MPSEQQVDRALSALRSSMEGFRSGVARAVDEVRTELEKRRRPEEGRASDAELGALAARLVDADRFAALFAEESLLDPEAYELLERAHEALSALDAADDRVFVEEVRPDASLRDAVEAGLARLGVAFGAARVAELAREGRHRKEAHAEHLAAFPPADWNRAERGVAPPLVVRTPGAALRAGALAEFVDGTQKLVLVVEGAAPPAALVRLVTPGVFILQTEDPTELERIDGFAGPAVAALFPERSGAALFAHDPSPDDGLTARLVIGDLPDRQDLRPIGPIGVSQQAEELAQLATLAAAPEPARVAAPSADGHADGAVAGRLEVQPADRLAAWLLRQANLRDLG